MGELNSSTCEEARITAEKAIMTGLFLYLVTPKSMIRFLASLAFDLRKRRIE